MSIKKNGKTYEYHCPNYYERSYFRDGFFSCEWVNTGEWYCKIANAKVPDSGYGRCYGEDGCWKDCKEYQKGNDPFNKG